MSPEVLTLATVLGITAAIAARVCGGTVVHVFFAALLASANVVVAQSVIDRVPTTQELMVVARPPAVWSGGHSAWLLSPNIYDPLPAQVDMVDSVTGIGHAPAAIAFGYRGPEPTGGHVPWLGWTALWLALLGAIAPGATSGVWLTRLLAVGAIAAGVAYPPAASYAQALAVALYAGLAARGLTWLDARGDEAYGATAPMFVGALAVIAGGAAIAGATALGIATDMRVVEPLFARLPDGDQALALPHLVASTAAHIRRVLDITAVVGAVSMSVILWHLKSRSIFSRAALIVAALVELVGTTYAFYAL